MRRGTTPTSTITTDIDLTAYKVILTLKQRGVELDVMPEVYADCVRFALTQEQTLMLHTWETVKLQLRAICGTNAIASNIMSVPVEEILKDGGIVDDRGQL